MILILDKSQRKSVYLPKNIPNSELPSGTHIELTITSELSHINVTGELDDEQPNSNIVYKADITDILSSLPDGEYVYNIDCVDDDEKKIGLGEGLLRIGNLAYNPSKYNHNAKRIIQYDGE